MERRSGVRGADARPWLRPRDSGSRQRHCAPPCSVAGIGATVAALLRHLSTSALINAPDAHHGSTPLGWCCHGSLHGPRDGDHSGVAQLLLTAGAAPGQFDASDEVESLVTGWTPPSSHGANGFSSAVGP